MPAPARAAADSSTTGSLTRQLQAWEAGDPSAFSRLTESRQGELQRMAASRMRGFESAILSRGDLLNEAMLRLMQSPCNWNDRAHFFATVSPHMRRVLATPSHPHIARLIARFIDGGTTPLGRP